MTYFLGNNPADLLSGQPRYFYALRRTDEGDLYITRVDQLSGENVDINNPGDPSENYEKFAVGVDFFNGRAVNHELTYDNLKFEQYRWDDRLLSYYIDEDGNLSVIIGKDRDYPTDI
jgi:hypothetical protein